jgi:methylated-DNA-[protein]-cysteine S-methyltransferase
MASGLFYTAYYNSPIGWLQLRATETHLISCLFVESATPETVYKPAILVLAIQQLDLYFNGKIHQFELDLLPEGTNFQMQVWQQLTTIPYGKTVSYLDVARAVSSEKAIRAVGAANGKNLLCVIIPCHRVIGSDGSLTGYAGGLWRKEWLLQHEGVLKPTQQLNLF